MSRGTAIRIRHVPGGYTPYGDPVPGDVDELPIENCMWAPREAGGSREAPMPATRHGTITGLTLYPPPGADILRTDFIRIEGVEYVVDATVGVWNSPYSGQPYGGEVTLSRREG